MALVKYGGGIVQMSGSIAGETFARNRYGNYARARTKPINPKTAFQTLIRSALAFITDRWAQALTAEQRTAWNLYASNVAMKNKLGEVIHLTGFNHYIRSNIALKRAGKVTVDDGPVIFELPAKDPTFAITASEGTQEIEFSWDDEMPWASETGAYLLLYQGQPQNAQRNFFDGPWKKIGHIAGQDGSPTLDPQAKAIVFAIAEGQRQWVYARILRADGRLSEVFRADTFCAA
jgi:hypothetical protein